MTEPVFESPYPVYLDLHDQRALVVGGGKVAAHKAANLINAGAHVTVVSPTAVDAIENHTQIRWHKRPYKRGEVASYRIAFTATNDPEVNAQVAKDADAANIFVNSADDPRNCSFILPAVAKHGDLQVAISTNGRSPALAKWLRRRFETELDDSYLELLELLSDARSPSDETSSN